MSIIQEVDITLSGLARLTGIKRRTLRSWRHKRRIPVQRVSPHLHTVSPATVRDFLDVCAFGGGRKALCATGDVADAVGVKRTQFYNYVLRGIPLPHMEPAHVAGAIASSRCLEYEEAKRVLRVKPLRFVPGGYGYLDPASVAALRKLNAAECEGWVPIRQYVQAVAGRLGGAWSVRDLQRLHRKIAALCSNASLSAVRGLHSRSWQIAPEDARRATLLFMKFRYAGLVICFNPTAELVEAELRHGLQAHPRPSASAAKAAAYTLGHACVGFLYAPGSTALAPPHRDALSIPSADLATGPLQQALTAFTRMLACQRRAYLPICQAPPTELWVALMALYERKVRHRQFRRLGDPQNQPAASPSCRGA